MAENGVARFPGYLDPSAQEFRPAYPLPAQAYHFPPFLSPLQQPPYFPDVFYSSPLPPPPQPPTFISPAFVPPSIPPPASSPTRALLLSAVPADVSESLVRRELEIFGDVRAVQMERVSEGIVTVHFYDLRAAHAALDAVREQHMQHQNRLRIYYSSVFGPNNYGPSNGVEALPPSPPPAPGLIAGRPVWAQFSVPATNAFPDGQNQGTIVIFNLNPNVSAHYLKDIFQNYGAVKELRETPMKKQQRFVEFFDVRDAARALSEMNNKEVNGRAVMIEYSRPGGHSNKKFSHLHHQNHSRNFHLNTNPPYEEHQPPLVRLRRTSPRQNPCRRRSSPSSEESLEAGIRGLALRGGGNVSSGSNNCVNKEKKVITKNNGGNCSSPGSNTSSKRQSGATKGMKPWKGKQKNFDPRFLIKEEAIIVEGESGSCKDTRTTVMIKNIPNKYSQKLLLNMLDNHCIHCNEQIIAENSRGGEEEDEGNVNRDLLPLSSYDFVYLPIDFNNKCNVGYGFVNMTSPEATLRLYKAFHHQHWEVFNSRKICEVTYARVQGLEALKEHFKNSKFACENDEYLPVVFTPPRDGRRLIPPLPIVFTAAPSTTIHYDTAESSEFTSSTMSTTIATTSSSSTSMAEHLHLLNSSVLLEDINDEDHDHHDDGNSSTNSSSSNSGEGVMMEGSSDSSMGCSVADN